MLGSGARIHILSALDAPGMCRPPWSQAVEFSVNLFCSKTHVKTILNITKTTILNLHGAVSIKIQIRRIEELLDLDPNRAQIRTKNSFRILLIADPYQCQAEGLYSALHNPSTQCGFTLHEITVKNIGRKINNGQNRREIETK